ncbi:hypothetical protein IW261DRAFT_1575181 [Armillaria novae-zelandiae]|uniref:Uncharacterized protein n=1 Tax=Armillaria novae-zelandiae TaxID=153914 RepID=A0AA39NFR3_9AGAR|nr:hypothetical protein IW261DRAFT_1575181 [Armillaria novae-zelandiae]
MALPSSLYQRLLPKLVLVLDLVQHSEGITTPHAKQALLHATNDFRDAVAGARRRALDLPGGEMMVGEQDEVLAMLTLLRDGKRRRLRRFSALVLPDDMDLDSTP